VLFYEIKQSEKRFISVDAGCMDIKLFAEKSAVYEALLLAATSAG
jgi:hypothetical protein